MEPLKIVDIDGDSLVVALVVDLARFERGTPAMITVQCPHPGDDSATVLLTYQDCSDMIDWLYEAMAAYEAKR